MDTFKNPFFNNYQATPIDIFIAILLIIFFIVLFLNYPLAGFVLLLTLILTPYIFIAFIVGVIVIFILSLFFNVNYQNLLANINRC